MQQVIRTPGHVFGHEENRSGPRKRWCLGFLVIGAEWQKLYEVLGHRRSQQRQGTEDLCDGKELAGRRSRSRTSVLRTVTGRFLAAYVSSLGSKGKNWDF